MNDAAGVLDGSAAATAAHDGDSRDKDNSSAPIPPVDNDREDFVPKLGLSWSYCCQHRLILRRRVDGRRVWWLEKSAWYVDLEDEEQEIKCEAEFTVGSHGIDGLYEQFPFDASAFFMIGSSLSK